MEMKRRKFWLSSIIKNLFLLQKKHIIASANSQLRHRTKERRRELVNLYKDIEACGGYEDIQVMWEMIHSSRPPNVKKSRSRKRFKNWKLCFKLI
ncbi:hypothetical protein CDL12_04301 [Handroanthus impetiginosus]|uniref:Uncharacterized protein n=1 Tax=Handroanthus impetiginosus TaxID=429701 RepID=A0A2G9HZP9_9LAMI|nr:hypothetical protein CDL12_04301 [Handroanthus impetiginosus]